MKQLFGIVLGCMFLLAGTVAADPAPGQDKPKPTTVKEKQADPEKAKGKDEKPLKKEEIEWKETRSGLKWVDLKDGDGAQATNGDSVTVHYHLWLADNEGGKAKSVQSSRDPSPYSGKVTPFSFRVGDRRLIKGWNEGMVGMQAGTLRRLWIPSELGYGANTVFKEIPANSDLIYEIELLEIHK